MTFVGFDWSFLSKDWKKSDFCDQMLPIWDSIYFSRLFFC